LSAQKTVIGPLVARETGEHGVGDGDDLAGGVADGRALVEKADVDIRLAGNGPGGSRRIAEIDIELVVPERHAVFIAEGHAVIGPGHQGGGEAVADLFIVPAVGLFLDIILDDGKDGIVGGLPELVDPDQFGSGVGEAHKALPLHAVAVAHGIGIALLGGAHIDSDHDRFARMKCGELGPFVGKHPADARAPLFVEPRQSLARLSEIVEMVMVEIQG